MNYRTLAAVLAVLVLGACRHAAATPPPPPTAAPVVEPYNDQFCLDIFAAEGAVTDGLPSEVARARDSFLSDAGTMQTERGAGLARALASLMDAVLQSPHEPGVLDLLRQAGEKAC